MLNDKQKNLVEAEKKNILCLAGAGSGKTHCIVEKIGYSIKNGMNPSNILALTFTKKAAQEMRDRITRNLGVVAGHAVGAYTLNSFCYQRIVKLDPTYFGYSDRPLKVEIDGYERILRQVLLDKDNTFIENVAIELEYALTRNLPLPSVAHIADKSGTESEIDLVSIFDRMRAYQFKHNLITFTDQIVFAYQRLSEDSAFRHLLASHYKFVIVDEAQDNNFMQNSIVLMLGSVHNNITAVGDDAQSMYRFRGADTGFFLSLKAKHGFDLYTLTTNYRSNQPILDLGNSILIPNFKAETQIEKYLVANNTVEASKPKLHAFFKIKEQTNFLVSDIQRQLYKGKKPKDIAILARTVKGSTCRYLPAALREANIPYKVVGGVDLTNSIHIKNMLAIFYLALGNTDRNNWITALSIFPAIGEVRSKQIAQAIPDWAKAKIPKISEDSVEELKELISLLSSNTDKAKECFLKYYAWYNDILDTHYSLDDKHGYTVRQRCVIEDIFSMVGETFEKYPNLIDAIDAFVMDEEVDEDGLEDNVVIISTIHRAKGLEWPVVYIPDCVDTMYPHRSSSGNISDIREELRIFHVAVTRARDELYLTADLSRQGGQYLSPFIDLNYVTLNTPLARRYAVDADEFWYWAKEKN